MKGINMKNNFEKRYAKGIKLDVRNKGTCYVTMKTNAGELTVYIDAMDGLTVYRERWTEIFSNKDLKGTTLCKAKDCSNYLYKNESPTLKGYCMDCG